MPWLADQMEVDERDYDQLYYDNIGKYADDDKEK